MKAFGIELPNCDIMIFPDELSAQDYVDGMDNENDPPEIVTLTPERDIVKSCYNAICEHCKLGFDLHRDGKEFFHYTAGTYSYKIICGADKIRKGLNFSD
jgi:hypothetical protein